jgi:hypothetical protein
MNDMNSVADQWLNAWNSRNIDNIMLHYADDIAFNSPLIIKLGFNETGYITGKDDLKKYFEIGLKKYPDLSFEMFNVTTGVSSLVIVYKSVNNMAAAEYMEVNDAGLITKTSAHYFASN